MDTSLVDSIHLGIDGNIFTSNEQKKHKDFITNLADNVFSFIIHVVVIRCTFVCTCIINKDSQVHCTCILLYCVILYFVLYYWFWFII